MKDDYLSHVVSVVITFILKKQFIILMKILAFVKSVGERPLLTEYIHKNDPNGAEDPNAIAFYTEADNDFL